MKRRFRGIRSGGIRSGGERSAGAMAIALAAALCAFGLCTTARAQGKGQPAAAGTAEEDAKGKEPKVKVERRGGKKVFRITTTFVIEGRIQKPNAFYVLQRSQINYDWAKLKQDFVPRIVHSVSKSPF